MIGAPSRKGEYVSMEDLRIRRAMLSDLPELYELASVALVHDAFSRELLAEKLFENRRSDEFAWQVFIAEQAGRQVGFMQSVVRAAAEKAWIGLFATDAGARRQGVARALFDRIRSSWPGAIHEAEVLAAPVNFFTPGLDPRYTEAVCFLEKLGFDQISENVNLEADLTRRFDTREDEQRLKALGVEIRRARREDDPLLDDFFAEHFGDDWRFEASLAMRNDPPTLHLAVVGGRVMAFSAHSTQNKEWGFFGPMGTAPEARGKGAGRVLLWRCLNDLRDAGHRTAVIPWVGPIAFYSQWVAARVSRIFLRYRLKL